MAPVIDAWIQHFTPDVLAHPMFATLLRWMRIEEIPDELPLELTIGALDAAGVDRALICAWHGPQGPLVSNDQVAAWVAEAP